MKSEKTLTSLPRTLAATALLSFLLTLAACDAETVTTDPIPATPEAAAPAAESTPELTVESTESSTEAIPEATPEPTPESMPVATPTASTLPTPESSTEATPEAATTATPESASESTLATEVNRNSLLKDRAEILAEAWASGEWITMHALFPAEFKTKCLVEDFIALMIFAQAFAGWPKDMTVSVGEMRVEGDYGWVNLRFQKDGLELDFGGEDDEPSFVWQEDNWVAYVSEEELAQEAPCDLNLDPTPSPEASPTTGTGLRDGTWIVGEEVAHGLWTSQGGEFCTWSRLKGFSGTFNDIIASDFGWGRQVVEVSATDVGFETSGCGMWRPIEETSISITEIPDGTWLVGDEIEAGTYAAPGGDLCIWSRLSGFGGTYEEVIASDFGTGRQFVAIAASDAGFKTSGCGAWRQIEEVLSSITEIPDGTWLVGDEIEAGTYAAPGGDLCIWSGLSGFSGTYEEVIASDFGTGRQFVAIAASDAGFKTSGCGAWRQIEEVLSSITEIPDGTWLVGDEIEAGTYAAPGGDLCIWSRLSGFSGTYEEVIASDFGTGRQFVAIAASDAGFKTSGCGAWRQIEEVLSSITEIPDGTWLVGDEIEAGTYAAPGGDLCIWSRLSGFSGTYDEVIASDFGTGRQVVAIAASDAGFKTSGCGAWRRQ